jgi:4-diphosphocytidyl-2-C-methyl-D-erythritol kinase
VDRGARLRLEKRIPPGRGFGGGSSDAAAALVALNALWGCALDRAELAALGAHAGSDVPLFLGSPLAVLRGRGEQVEPVQARCSWRLVLAWPDYGLSTAEVYAAYDRLGPGDAGEPAATAVLDRLDGPAAEAGPFLVNDLTDAADNIRAGRFDVRACLRQAGAEAVGMTGSGSAWFAAADRDDRARQWADAARAAGAQTCIATLLVDGVEQHGRTP